MGELRQTVVVTAAPRAFRVSVFGGRTQLDIELPSDVPVADIVPELAELISSRDIKSEEATEALQDRRDRWVLTRLDTDEEIPADRTLAEAGSHDGDLLSLTTERALNPPELFDDVVDAVARLNREGFAVWGVSAARRMAFFGLALAVGVIDLFLLRPGDLDERTMLGYQTVGVIIALIVAAATAQRFYDETSVATALGWATLPLVFGATTVFSHHLPDSAQRWSPVIACAAVMIAACAVWALLRVGRIGFLSSAIAFAFFTAAAAAHVGFHWTGQITGPILAAAGTILAVNVSALTAWLRRHTVGTNPDAPVDPTPESTELFVNPFDHTAPREQQRRAASQASARVPSAQDVAAAVARIRDTRTALFLAAAAIAIVGATVAVGDAADTPWSVITANAVVAIAMALHSTRRLPLAPSAILLLAGIAIVVLTCVSLRTGPTAMYDVAAGVLLVLVVVGVIAGVLAPRPAPTTSLPAVFDYLEYVAVLAVLPTMAWAVGLYSLAGRG
ncbi:type VII secretion integral membrane protein EccD [Gordonia sp. ABSL1-1]|uniref:type VII secretion integral membrane protein EccD n=1 Tax=Gordonia sp. ABSL1-1 TaxID=3053923 RepID=UPI00257474FE|nr:type VII secretion integral membrane protein EccD [Gordonia sp. ABSL1-1]MDL9937764.1 type VII secretion integral membrane protein EccD [Gordonia sp. ABSL1-1]